MFIKFITEWWGMACSFYHDQLSDTEYMYGDRDTRIIVKESIYRYGQEKYIEYIKVSNSPKRKKSAFYINGRLSGEYKEECRKIGEDFLGEERYWGTKQDGSGIYEKPQKVLDKINDSLYKSLRGKKIR